jgi:hypothetical protein
MSRESVRPQQSDILNQQAHHAFAVPVSGVRVLP